MSQIYSSSIVTKLYINLTWKPTLNYDQTVRMTSEWYSSFYNDSPNILNKSIEQINEFEEIANSMG